MGMRNMNSLPKIEQLKGIEAIEEVVKKPRNMAEAMYNGNKCSPNLILNQIKSTRLWTDKKKILAESLAECGTKPAKKSKKIAE